MSEMKRYRHKEHGYIVEAEAGPSVHSSYYIEGYQGYTRSYGGTPREGYLAAKDFKALFEPVEKYCCDWFTKCVRNRIIRKSTASRRSGQVWVWDALDEYFEECPFCKTKL